MHRVFSQDEGRQGQGAALCDGQRLAVCVLRRAAGASPQCRLSGDAGTGCVRELADIAKMFAPLLQEPPAVACMRAVRLGLPGCAGITKDERRLLNVIAAVQAGDEALADHFLYRLALERGARGCLARAAAQLAAWLAVNGYWLPCPGQVPPVPVAAAALAVARRQGMRPGDFAVSWP